MKILFCGKEYTQNQMREMNENDSNCLAPLSDWIKTSNVYEFTGYYKYIIFHTPRGFFAAYADNLDNYWQF